MLACSWDRDVMPYTPADLGRIIHYTMGDDLPDLGVRESEMMARLLVLCQDQKRWVAVDVGELIRIAKEESESGQQREIRRLQREAYRQAQGRHQAISWLTAGIWGHLVPAPQEPVSESDPQSSPPEFELTSLLGISRVFSGFEALKERGLVWSRTIPRRPPLFEGLGVYVAPTPAAVAAIIGRRQTR